MEITTKKYAANLATMYGGVFESLASNNLRKILRWASGRGGRYTLDVYVADLDADRYRQIDIIEYKAGRRVRGSGQLR